MTTSVTFYEDPLNIDDLMADVRVQFGDITGALFSDVIIRTSIVSAIRTLAPRWNSKYQIFNESQVVNPQPSNVPAGYVFANTVHGQGLIPNNLINGDIFRNPYIVFASPPPPIIEELDKSAIILQAKIILRVSQISSSSDAFISIGTEDIKYSNLAAERSLGKLLDVDQASLDALFRTKIARPQISAFNMAPISSVPVFLP